jgi:hypothetical protein
VNRTLRRPVDTLLWTAEYLIDVAGIAGAIAGAVARNLHRLTAVGV